MFLLHNSKDNYKFTQYTTKKYLASSLTNTGKVFGGKRVNHSQCHPPADHFRTNHELTSVTACNLVCPQIDQLPLNTVNTPKSFSSETLIKSSILYTTLGFLSSSYITVTLCITNFLSELPQGQRMH